MTDEENERLLKKIRACFARADASRNDNEHERATALRQANALMDKHSISMLELGDGDAMGERGQSEAFAGANTWRQDLYFSLAPLYGCKCLNDRGEMLIMGRRHYRNVVLDMGIYLQESINRQAKAHGGGKMVMNNFRKGAVMGVRENIQTMIKAREKAPEPGATGSSMVLVDHFKNELALNDAYMNERYPHTGAAPRRSALGVGGYAGFRAGKGIGLNDQIGGKG